MQAIPGKQKSVYGTLDEIQKISERLVKESFDHYISAVDEKGCQTIIWPANLEAGKQLDGAVLP